MPISARVAALRKLLAEAPKDDFTRWDIIGELVTIASETDLSEVLGNFGMPPPISRPFHSLLVDVLESRGMSSKWLPPTSPLENYRFYNVPLIPMSESRKEALAGNPGSGAVLRQEVKCPVGFCPLYGRPCTVKFMLSPSSHLETPSSRDLSRLEHPSSGIHHFVDRWFGGTWNRRKQRWRYFTLTRGTSHNFISSLLHRDSEVWLGCLIEKEGPETLLNYWTFYTPEQMYLMNTQPGFSQHLWVEIMFLILTTKPKPKVYYTSLWEKVVRTASVTCDYLNILTRHLEQLGIIERTPPKTPQTSHPSSKLIAKDLSTEEQDNLAKKDTLDVTFDCTCNNPSCSTAINSVILVCSIGRWYRDQHETHVKHVLSGIGHVLRHLYLEVKTQRVFGKWRYVSMATVTREELKRYTSMGGEMRMTAIVDSHPVPSYQETDI